MRNPQSQDKLDIFRRALEKNIPDWKTFFELDTDQRASAEQLLQENNILSATPKGNYRVNVQIRGIVPTARTPRDELEKTQIYFKNRIIAESLLNFYLSKGQRASIEQL
jgi:hypothetical protein